MDPVYTVVVIGLNLHSSYNDYRLVTFVFIAPYKYPATTTTTVAATVAPSMFT